MGVSKNNATPKPKSSISIGSSTINHPFWGTPIFGNPHIGIPYTHPKQPFWPCFFSLQPTCFPDLGFGAPTRPWYPAGRGATNDSAWPEAKAEKIMDFRRLKEKVLMFPKNRGTPKSSISIGFSPIYGLTTPIYGLTLRKTNEYPLKRDYFSRECIFQPLIFRGHVNFQGSICLHQTKSGHGWKKTKNRNVLGAMKLILRKNIRYVTEQIE